MQKFSVMMNKNVQKGDAISSSDSEDDMVISQRHCRSSHAKVLSVESDVDDEANFMATKHKSWPEPMDMHVEESTHLNPTKSVNNYTAQTSGSSLERGEIAMKENSEFIQTNIKESNDQARHGFRLKFSSSIEFEHE